MRPATVPDHTLLRGATAAVIRARSLRSRDDRARWRASARRGTRRALRLLGLTARDGSHDAARELTPCRHLPRVRYPAAIGAHPSPRPLECGTPRSPAARGTDV